MTTSPHPRVRRLHDDGFHVGTVEPIPAPRPVTLPACPGCGELLRPECIRAVRDRRAVRFLACRCGHQEGHEVEREEEDLDAIAS